MAAVFEYSTIGFDGTEFSDGFIKRFFADEDVTRIAQSVTVFQRFKRNVPRSYLPTLCGTPRQQGVEAPRRLVEELPPPARYDAQKCDLFVFKNAGSGRELQLYAMTARAMPEPSENVTDLFVINFTMC